MTRLLVLVDGTELGLQAVSLAQTLGEIELVTTEEESAPGFPSWRIEHPLLNDYAPEALAEALAQLVAQEMPTAVVAPGSERGNEVMAHLASLLDLPLAANVLSIEVGGDDWNLRRMRWGGSLIEEATLSAFVKLITVAPHSQPAWGPTGSVDERVFIPSSPTS